ncbi:MAG: PHP domain-containing protein [Desulfomicrobium escambiense]|nr:PHP domain-containing protein [Desulfomicrobium escambiense]
MPHRRAARARPRGSEMPALAVTDHGNMFSAVVFHDAARKQGIKPILGCEVYVAPGQPPDERQAPSARRHNHLIAAGARPTTGYHNLVKLVSVGLHSRASTTSRASTRTCWRSTARASIGLSRLPQGRGRRAHRCAGAERGGAASGGAFTGHPRRGQLLPRGAGPRHRRSSGVVNHGLLPLSAKTWASRWSATNDVHYLRRDDHQAARRPAVHRHGQDGERRRAPALRRRPVLPEVAPRRWRAVFGRPARRRCANTVAIAERCDVDLLERASDLPELRRARGLHARELLRAGRARGLRAAPARGCEALRAAGRAAPPDRRLRGAARLRDRRHQADAASRATS